MKIVLDIDDKFTKKYSEYDFKMFIASSLYEKGLLNSSAAAKMIDVPYNVFILEMGKYGKSIFEIPEEQIERDVKVAAKFVK